ncbi:MAG: Helicase associated domain protein [Candidatus Babeliaceae bacterium]|nr:Helicase associated domain protein [Candidatus Babeliaceae bacterium]
MIPKHKKSHYFRAKGLFSDLFSFKELEKRIANLPEVERGDAFEVFAEAYLRTQPIHQVEEIWPEKSLPQSLRELLNIPSDAGIDGVFKTSSGHYKAYQVKFRSNRGPLSWGSDNLGNFFGQADRVSERVLFTNSVDLSDLASSRINFYSIKGNELDCVEPSDFKTIEDWLKTGVVRREGLKPKNHQQQAIDAITSEFAAKDRATAIMACGTGKTLVALKSAEKLQAKTILVLLPSLALIRQTLHDWARDHGWDKFHFLCVCSDQTVTNNDQAETLLSQRDLDFAVTTQPKEIAAFLNNGNIAPKIIFSTYQSCRMVAQAMPAGFTFDLAIFDEAHKTASRLATNHAFALSENNIAIKKRLFLTATPRHYNIDVKDKFGDGQLVFSMDDETIYGRVAYKLSFRTAVEQGLICDYKVVISVITSDMLSRELLKRGEVLVDGDIIKAQRIANILAIQNAVEKYSVKKIFSFHSSISAAKSFTAKTNEGIGVYLIDFATMHVSGEMSSSKRDGILSEFRNAEKALISNARCLTEGVNVPAVDMVAFVSPKKSKVDIAQAAGRAMRRHEGKTRGYILIPLFVQMGESEILEEALNKTRFDAVWDVLQAMQEQDENLVEIIAKLRESRGRALGINDNRLRDIIEVLGPELLLSDLRKTITTNIIDKLGSSWNEYLGLLQNYADLNGHSNVPWNYTVNKHNLGSWVSIQRKKYKNKKMPIKEINLLEKIEGWTWSPLDTNWDEGFLLLCDYLKTNGNLDIPYKFVIDGFNLNQWVQIQRRMFRKKLISLDRIKKLESLDGWTWDFFDKKWDMGIKKLNSFYIREGHLNIPHDYIEQEFKLGVWIRNKKKSYKDGNLPRDKQLILVNYPEWQWDNEVDIKWDNHFSLLQEFERIKGHSRVPRGYKLNGFNLDVWVSTQRRANFLNKLSAEKIKKLESLSGWTWNTIDYNNEKGFEALDKFVTREGHALVPTNHVEADFKLGVWVSKQRLYYAKGTLKKDLYCRLITYPDWYWNANDGYWDFGKKKLLIFYDRNKHILVKNTHIEEGFALGKWIQMHRYQYKKQALSAMKINFFESFSGWTWDFRTDEWNKGFEHLTKYIEQNKNASVPTDYINSEGFKLGIWICTQRYNYKKSKLPLDRIRRLNSVGFMWEASNS